MPGKLISESIADVLPQWNKPWYRVPHLLRLNLLLIVPLLSASVIGYDGSMLNGLQLLPKWQSDYNHPTGAILGTISNGPGFGYIIALPIAPWISDYLGRKPSIGIGAFITIVGAALQAAAQNWAMFFISRIIIGVGGCIAATSSPLLIAELSYPTHRDVYTASYNMQWYLGSIIASAITIGTYTKIAVDSSWSWRVPSLLQLALPVFQLLFVWFIPESPRFLISKGRTAEAKRILAKYHTNGDEEHPLIQVEYEQIFYALENEKQHSKTGPSAFLEFVKTNANRRRLLIIIAAPAMQTISGNGIISYYLGLVLDTIGIRSTHEQLTINLCLSVFNFVMCGIFLTFIKNLRRRVVFLTSLIAMTVCYIIWTVLSAVNQQRNFEDKSLARGVLAMIFFYFASYDFGFNGLPYLYYTEILPFHLRSTGMSFVESIINVYNIFNGYVNPIAMSHIGWKYYIVYCCWLPAELAIAYFFFPETKGHTLETVWKVFGDAPPEFESYNKDFAAANQKDDGILIAEEPV